MSVEAHKSAAPARVVCGVLTVSDTRTLETDTSGRTIASLLEDAGHEVADRQIVPDERDRISGAVRDLLARGEIQAVIVTGGTGLTPRDVTVEAVAPLFDRTIDGFGELFRMLSYEDIGAPALLSRATAGIVQRRPVFLLPGSEKAVRLAMAKLIIPELGHLVGQLGKG